MGSLANVSVEYSNLESLYLISLSTEEGTNGGPSAATNQEIRQVSLTLPNQNVIKNDTERTQLVPKDFQL